MQRLCQTEKFLEKSTKILKKVLDNDNFTMSLARVLDIA